jgi:hypothetical protein
LPSEKPDNFKATDSLAVSCPGREGARIQGAIDYITVHSIRSLLALQEPYWVERFRTPADLEVQLWRVDVAGLA